MNSNSPVKRSSLFTVTRISLTLLVAIMLAIGGGCSRIENDTASGVSSSVPDYEIPTIDGKTIRLSQFRGKVVVIDFWATWCGPCQAETPHLVQIAKDLSDKGVVVIGLSVDDPVTPVAKFVQDFGINYTVGYAPAGMFEKFDTSGSGSIPQTLIFGRDGHKLLQTAGFDPLQSGEELRRTVEKAL